MRELQVRQLLVEAIKEALHVCDKYREEWSAGRQRGIKDALELLDRVVVKAERLSGQP